MILDIPICAQKCTGTQQLLSCCPKTIPKHRLSHHLDMGTSVSRSAGGTPGALGMLGGTWRSTAHRWHRRRGAFSRRVGDILFIWINTKWEGERGSPD